jgi:uroporphyrinogen-III decarboxylase
MTRALVQEVGERWLKEHPEASQRLLDILTDVVIDYMSAQVQAGADLLQVRDTTRGSIPLRPLMRHHCRCCSMLRGQPADAACCNSVHQQAGGVCG